MVHLSIVLDDEIDKEIRIYMASHGFRNKSMTVCEMLRVFVEGQKMRERLQERRDEDEANGVFK